jgi:formate hydrogenlyase subunit 6/NADH:ubiquinone oxidoreductase subunit I
MTPDAVGVPVIDYSACINCLSCDESCPHEAILQEMSWLAKKLQ